MNECPESDYLAALSTWERCCDAIYIGVRVALVIVVAVIVLA